ncbi:kinase-like protein [Melanogaster broomeanus]|nr:kinase-like protein [Melanogaster broomeanus]
MSATNILKLSPDEIGRGAYGLVLWALDTTSGTSLAVKKSRVSIRIKRTLLHYEAKVLQRLSGHSAIPTLYGYGRFPHFEYLAMELGGKSVGDIVKQNEGCGVQVKTVILLALQMISALQHIHSHGLVHRDVKPDHMLLSLRDSSQIVFVDYGITCPRPQVNTPKRYDPELERRQVVGTLKWASLNAHHGLHLSWRDDLISLAYVLLFLLRGSLPWVSRPRGSTTVGAAVRLRLAKEKRTGSQLAQGYPAEFGHFLDQAKDLEFDEAPPYERYMELFEDLYRRSGFSDTDRSFDWTPVTTSPSGLLPVDREPKSQGNHQLVPGQIIAAQLMPEVSVLGVLPDDELWSMVERKTSPPRRPAVVLKAFTGVLRQGVIESD